MKWIGKPKMNLLVFCLVTLINAAGFGFFYGNTAMFGDFYNVPPSYIEDIFFVGLVMEILFFYPALRIIEWRLDYSILAAAFLTFASYWIQFLAQQSYVIVIACNCLLSLGQALILPVSPYFAEKWFELEHRSFVIALGFYSNIFGLAFGGIFTAVYTDGDLNYIGTCIFIIALIATGVLLVAMAVIRNPKRKIESYKPFSMQHLKLLWRQKFNTYSVFMSSVFLGMSWIFMSTSSKFLNIFPANQVGILVILYNCAGCVFGVGVSFLIDRLTSKKGSSHINDITFKVITFLAVVGFGVLGMIYDMEVKELWPYVIIMLVIGIGNMGGFGLMFLSFIETLYPVSSLFIGTILGVGASIYSALVECLSDIYIMNVFYICSIALFLPWVFITVVYHTDMKRYKYYLNEKKAIYELLKVEEMTESDQQSHID